MVVLNSPQLVQETSLRWKKDGKIAIVPTMGALHEGHLKLVETARQFAQKIIVSIFVNPLQFSPSEDFARYPRPFEEDQAKCEAAGVDVIFAPTPADMYPEGFQTRVLAGELGRHMEGKSRPGHFDGVATVCLKLFQISQADLAIFGQKDYQQLRIVTQMTADLNLPLTILPVATVRESDGLALSSRNRYLSPEDRKLASRIPRALERARESALTSTVDEVLQRLASDLARPLEIDYAAIASSRDLMPVTGAVPIRDLIGPRLFVAVRIGRTRLIDNVALSGDPS